MSKPKGYELGWMSVAAHKKAGTDPEKFGFYRAEFIAGNDVLLEGASIIGTIKSGPRKGRPKYAKETTMVTITKRDTEVAQSDYEEETDNCWQCLGIGFYQGKPCKRCKP